MLHRVAKHHRGNMVVTTCVLLLSVLVAIVVNVAAEATTSTSSSIVVSKVDHPRRVSSRVDNIDTASSIVGIAAATTSSLSYYPDDTSIQFLPKSNIQYDDNNDRELLVCSTCGTGIIFLASEVMMVCDSKVKTKLMGAYASWDGYCYNSCCANNIKKCCKSSLSAGAIVGIVFLIIVILGAIGFGVYYTHKNKLYCFQDATTTTTNGTTATTDKPIETTSNPTISTTLPHERDATIPSNINGNKTNGVHETINTVNDTAANLLNAANLVNDMTENNSESTYDYTIPTDSYGFAQFTSSVLNFAANNMAAARSSSVVEPTVTEEPATEEPATEEPITEPEPIVDETVSQQ
jgi:hypothetical protein